MHCVFLLLISTEYRFSLSVCLDHHWYQSLSEEDFSRFRLVEDREVMASNPITKVPLPTLPLFKCEGYERWCVKVKTLFRS